MTFKRRALQERQQKQQETDKNKSSQTQTTNICLVLAFCFIVVGGFNGIISNRFWKSSFANFRSHEAFILPSTVKKHTDSNPILQRMQNLIHVSKTRLQNLNFTYYIYDDDGIAHLDITKRYLAGGGLNLHQKYRRSVTAELDMINAMYDHPLRTWDTKNAGFYLIPTSTGVKWSMQHFTDWSKTLEKVVESPNFKRTHGHRHILISTLVPLFSWKHLRWIGDSGLIPYYEKLWNITVVTNVDWAGCQYAYHETKHYHGPDDFSEEFFDKSHNMARYGVSVGWLASNSMPYIEATYEKFENSNYFLFYHCRSDEEFLNNSTVFRMAPLKPEVSAALPKSSLGHELPPGQWQREFSDSKFCLVVRGDIPHSHALMRAVRVGCIPVLAADAYHYYAQTFKSSILIEDYSILFDEEEFVSSPAKTLQKLTQLTKEEIEAKLLALRYAQQLTTPNHPESLFVPALLYEVNEAQKRPFRQKSYPYGDKKTWKVFSARGY